MSLTRKASSTRKKPMKPPRQDLAAALAEREAELAEARRENALLFDEAQARAQDLTEALQQLTATADILKAIASSPSDVQPVFEAVAERAMSLLAGWSALVVTFDGEQAHFGAARGALPDTEQFVRRQYPSRPPPGSPLDRCLVEHSAISHPDFNDIESSTLRDYARTRGFRAILCAPMLRNGQTIGAIVVTRREAGDFAAREVSLLQTFADQAAIAIENTRLFRETQEALRRQTATSDILRVIASSPGDMQPVLDTLVETTCRLCGAYDALILLRESDDLRIAAHYGPIPLPANFVKRPISRDWPPGRAVADRKTVHVPDLAAAQDEYPVAVAFSKEGTRTAAPGLAWRTALATPLMREAEAIGVIVLRRAEVWPFTEAQIALLQTFADQAVIAIENARLFDEVQAKTRDLEEALEQQTATSDVLKAISRSAFDLETVLQSLISTALRLCNAKQGVIFRRHGDIYRYAASHMLVDPAYRAHEQMAEIKAGRGTLIGRVALENRTVQIEDAWNDPDYAEKEEVRRTEVRAMLGVPLLRNGEPIGAFGLGRSEPVPFTQRQIELVTTFADQAVIAIENVRLFDEVQARTRDLSEALEQQTATADVLKAISRTAFDLDTVLQTLISTAVRLCDSSGGEIFRRHGDVFRYAASLMDLGPAYLEHEQKAEIRAGRGTLIGRVAAEKRTVEIADAWNDPEYAEKEEARVGGVRAMLGVPLMRNGELIGAFALGRTAPVPFTKRQVELVTTFADQAVIAIENVRLFDEVQARTRDVEEALQQQTATAEVLKVISRSAFDLQAVWRTLVESACTLCEAPMGLIELLDGDVFRLATQKGYGEALERYLLETPLRAGSSSGTGRAASTGEVSHIPDVLQDPDYLLNEAQRLAGYRSNLAVPLLREDKVIGVFVLGRPTPGPFTERQIELVKTFADQAVIAIENVRLFDEVQARTRDLSEALQQQTATAEVLKVISRSAFDLDVVFDALLTSAVSLVGSRGGTICVREGEGFRYRAVAEGRDSAIWRYLSAHPPTPGRGSVAGRVLLSGRPEIITDSLLDGDLKVPVHSLAGSRAVAGVPLLRDDKVEGALIVGRAEAGPFDSRQIEVLQTFADQAVIAIENVRLFDELQTRTRDLQEALQQQTATADVLKVISRSAFDLQAVLTTLAESARELCGASFVTLFMRDGDEMRLGAESGCTPEIVAFLHAHPIRAGRETFTGRVMASGEAVHLPDVLADAEYDFGDAPRIGNYRAVLGIPLLREGRVEGIFGLARPEPIPFTDRQIEMVRAFADQAVIAIENSRLFDEVQARTRELAASLDDLRKAQDRLIQSEKLASLGQLTAGIAHEIKNPLNFVNNFSALSRELVGELADVIKAAPLDDARREEAEELIGTIDANLDKVVQHGRRADSIVKNMLLHSREGSGERSATNVNAMVEEALNLAYHGARAEKPGFNVTIVKSLDPNAGTAEVYTQEMTRVLLNLISNGFYATTKRQLAGADGAYEPTLTATTRDLGRSVEIAIRDNGTGIPEEVKAKMFNPFFTTKPAGEGTGLGLSLSHDIVVKQHGGTLEVSTEPGAYTQFTIALPRAGAGK
jgi:GAF domain-containing protein